jgi:alpha-ketoglutarate-dependent 2,4-dichlorophenoxyacetate dioxygenase
MSVKVSPLTPVFAARLTGIDLAGAVSDAEFAEIRAAFEAHSVLVLPDQPMSDDRQIAFSERFGPLERTIGANPAGGTPFARQSNVDIRTGAVIPPDDRRMDYQKGNMQWHADSTFKTVPSLCSILTAREVPPEGGATEFASTRAAWESLPEAMQRELDGLTVEHDLIFSRRRVGFEFTEQEAAETPPVRHPLVQVNPVTGRKSLLIGAHAARIVGWSQEKGTALLDDLLERAARPAHQYRHEWRGGDIVVWDNRSVLHRATPYDGARYRRVMQRTTISYPEAVAANA